MEPAFSTANFKADGAHSCCQGYCLVTPPEWTSCIWRWNSDRCFRFWNTTNGNRLNSVDTGSQVCNLAWSKNVNEIGFGVPKEEQEKVAKFSFHGQQAELKHGYLEMSLNLLLGLFC